MPAVSQSQQRLMGQAYALKKGDLKPEDLNPEYREQIEDLAKGMTLKQLKDYAETSHDDLPKKIKEMKNIPTFDSYINENLNEAKFTPKQGLMEILDMLNDGWTKDEVANIILNATKGKLDLSAYTGFNGNELSKESQYTK